MIRLLLFTLFTACFCVLSVIITAQDSPLQILEMPLPERPADYGTLDAQGTFVVKVQFLASGKVGATTLITSSLPRLGKLAESASKEIKFRPEVRDGVPVDSLLPVAYTYSWRHAGWKTHSVKVAHTPNDDAEAILQKAIQKLGGDRYLKVTTQVGRGRFSSIRDGMILQSQTFIDVIAYPDKERTEFKGRGTKFVQTNSGSSGWVYDGDQELIKVQTEEQVANFHRGMRVSIDTLLRGHWRGKGEISYLGKRPSTLGKRNDVVKLTYEDGLTIEFEFADDGTPMKASYKRTNSEGEEVTEEDRYAQWVDIGGIRTPYIVDRFVNGKPSSRINYDSIEYNVRVPDSIFNKPSNPKDLKKDLKL